MNIKYLFAAMAFLGAATLASAQVFEENMGKLNANMSASDYYEEGGFANNKQFVFEGDAEVQYTGATPKNADYTTLVGNSASRGCNVRIGDSYGTYFQISGINTMGMKKPVVGFALLKGVRRFDGTDLVVEYSKDGVGWTALDFEPLSTEEGSQLTFTYRVTSKLPNAENLSIRFRQNGNACVFRIDDVCVAPKNYKK
ncbi:MAG TPA: hypothetical protein DCF48_05160 [Rikenellaceae bacterium]|nr:hypothetical protein [Rikenellaceae bacterium]